MVLQGEVHIEDPYNNSIIVKHGKYEFTGDSGMLSNRVAQFHAVAQSGTSVLRIEPQKLKKIISKNSDISDMLLNAFVLPQKKLLCEMNGGLKIVGSGKSNATYKIRDFLKINHI